MTAEEESLYEQTRQEMLADIEANEAEQQAKATAKQAVIAKLGLTADEISALLS